jgi:hypothetical protein
MVNAYSHALSIEHVLRRVFNFEDRGGLAGLIDADAIENNWYVPIAAGLGYLYARADATKKAEIETFIEKNDYYLDMSMNQLLRFEKKGQEIDGYSIEYDTGEQAIEAVIETLRKICKD